MKNMIDICKDFGLEIPADKQADFNKAVAENYKTVAEYDKKVNRLETNLETQKNRADTAEETLKGFEGIDPAKINDEIATYKKQAEEAAQNAQKQLDERDFNDALKAEMESYNFTSAAAKKAVMSEIQSAGLKLKGGKILGLSDLIEQIKKDDASAFVDEDLEDLKNNKAKFTGVAGTKGDPRITKEDIMKISDRTERRAAIAKNLHLFNIGE